MPRTAKRFQPRVAYTDGRRTFKVRLRPRGNANMRVEVDDHKAELAIYTRDRHPPESDMSHTIPGDKGPILCFQADVSFDRPPERGRNYWWFRRPLPENGRIHPVCQTIAREAKAGSRVGVGELIDLLLEDESVPEVFKAKLIETLKW